MIKTLLFLIISSSLFGQTTSIKGTVIDQITKEPIPFAKVSLYKGEKIVSGASTDFDGRYSLNKIDSLETYRIEIRQVTCYVSISIEEIKLLNDSTITTYELTPINCADITEKHCKFHNDSCDIYEVKYTWDYPRVKGKHRKKETETNEDKVVYLNGEFYMDGCCEKKSYCKTHNYRY